MNVQLSKEKADKLKRFLIDNQIKYETSECFDYIHFEVFISIQEVTKVNDFLMNL